MRLRKLLRKSNWMKTKNTYNEISGKTRQRRVLPDSIFFIPLQTDAGSMYAPFLP